MKKNILLSLSIFFSLNLLANGTQIKKLNWNGIEVVWLVDERMPTYEMIVHFADGALSDEEAHWGVTNFMFGLLESGTNRFNQKQIADNLEFYGTSFGASVSHESTSYRVSGLVKDLAPSVKQVCHLFKDAIFPEVEIKKTKRSLKSSLLNMGGNPQGVASLAFRELSMAGTPYNYPVSGKYSDIKKIKRSQLKAKLKYFNKSVAKRVYIAGPKKILALEKILTEDCGWSNSGNIVREVAYFPRGIQDRPEITLVTIPKANQAQVRIGRFLNEGEYDNDTHLSLATHYLGGGFTSRLMQEIRVKRGLSYGVSAYAGGQRQYGRSIISTFTKFKTTGELLTVLKDTLSSTATEDGITDKRYNMAKNGLSGSHPFSFESKSSYLSQLKHLNNLGKSFDELYNFSEKVLKISKKELSQTIKKLYDWNNMTIVVVGTKKLLPQLKKFGKVKIIDYKKFIY